MSRARAAPGDAGFIVAMAALSTAGYSSVSRTTPARPECRSARSAAHTLNEHPSP
jgi:hypothetical protein